MDQRVRAVIGLMNANLHRRVTVNKMAGSVSLSPSHLAHLFKQETGKPLAGYLRKLRMERARELLETTFLSIKQIAASVGQSSNHFATAFKKTHRVTPSQFAARYRRTPPAK
jgi:AraC family transcriptional regulator of arabinose operon